MLTFLKHSKILFVALHTMTMDIWTDCTKMKEYSRVDFFFFFTFDKMTRVKSLKTVNYADHLC